MDYRSLKVKDENIDIVEKKVILSKAEIEQATERVREKQNLPVTGTKVTGKGVLFVGPYDIILGKYVYSEEHGKFELKFSKNVEENYRTQRRKAKQKKAVRKFVFTKALPVAGAVFIGTWGLFSFIQNANEKVNLSNNSDVSIVDVADPNALSLNNADLPIVLAWADYAMNEYYEDVNNSEFSEYKIPRYERTYQEDFLPLHSSYEAYYEVTSSGLPSEMVGETAEKSLGRVRDSAKRLNEDVPDDAKFGETVFTHAIIIDEDAKNKYAMDVDIYVPLAELKNTNYSIENLPDDAIIYEGEVYVLYTHIFDKVNTDSKTMN